MNKCNDCNSKVRTSCRGCIHFYSGYSDLFEPKKPEPRVLWVRVDDAGKLIGPTFERKDNAEDDGAKVVQFIEVSSLRHT